MAEFFNSSFQSWWHWLLPIVVTTMELLGLASAWHAVTRVRTSQAAVAWAVGLVALPALVLPMYWLLGRNKFSGYREAIRQVEGEHKLSVEAVRRELLTPRNVGTHRDGSPVAVLADILDTPLCTDNRFHLLIDGEAFFNDLIQQISSAQKYVYAEFYIIRDDEVGNRFAEALCKQARHGKTVRLLYDEVGCLKLSNAYLRRLREAGVDVHAFNTRQGWANRFQLNFRNHRKLLVVDGRRAIVGGLNIGDEYAGKAKWAPRWRDTALRVEGTAARKLQAVFAADYYWAQRLDIPEAIWSDVEDRDDPALDPADEQTETSTSGSGRGQAAVCATGPSDQRERATMMFAAAAQEARDRCWICTPYLVPDSTCINALSMARARGVDVRLLIPACADQWLVYLAGFYYERVFEQVGIPVYRYPDGFLHQKCVLVDDQLALIGSTNLDNRSLHLNFELMVAANEPRLIAEVTEMLEQDFALSEKMNPGQGRLLPWYIRIGTVLARLFSPVL
ncbi:cardiolipin synthase [Roseimaritima ulvae]|uniref:Cardiolipin synthase n=1 Tax=Roseimaritima ulvae TaxID=980254 RepID=A0A5B9R0W7_9BACT|nr:cardiolipin synthase [Roseimaritima ulvae]QEG39871.1 putative cardiolipin synthase YwiE [Roseimaritima ulvae]